MFEQLKRLSKETAIYGTSMAVTRLLSFLLTPLYTNVLTPDDFGIVATLFAYAGIMLVVYSFGFDAAYFKYASTGELGSRDRTLATPWLSLVASSLAFTALLVVFASPIGAVLGFTHELTPTLVRYVALILLFDTLSVLPNCELRSSRRAKMFASLRIVNIFLNVGFNILFLLVYHRGIEGIFLANVLSSGLTLAIISFVTLRNLTIDFSLPTLREFLGFGLPYVPAALATILLQVVDRPILKYLTDDPTVGLYNANYRLGIIMMLLVSMFEYAWRPFFLAHASEPNVKELFARILTYFTLGASFVFLIVSMWIGDVVRIPLSHGRHLIAPEYWSGLGIVPIILAGYIFNGFYTNFIAGIYIEKKTRLLPKATFAGAISNIILNFALIPFFGIYGAAYATLLAYAIMAFYLYKIIHPIYPVPYEFGRILRLGIVLVVSYLLYIVAEHAGFIIGWGGWGIRLGLVLFFISLLFAVKFFDEREKKFFARRFPAFFS